MITSLDEYHAFFFILIHSLTSSTFPTDYFAKSNSPHLFYERWNKSASVIPTNNTLSLTVFEWKKNIRLNNVEAQWIFIYSTGTQFKPDVVLSTTFLCAVSFPSRIDHFLDDFRCFSSIEFLLTNYRTYNRIMECSCEYLVAGQFETSTLTKILVPWLRGQCWSVKRRVIFSLIFTGYHPSRRGASAILLHSCSLSLEQLFIHLFFCLSSRGLYASVTSGSFRLHNSYVKSDPIIGTSLSSVERAA